MINEKHIDSFIKAIDKASDIAVISHMSPDGDTMGAALALFCALKLYGKNVYVFCENNPPKRMTYLPNSEVYNSANLPKYDLAIAVDTSSYDRMGLASSEFEKAKATMNIDHHVTNTNFANTNIVNVCAATCEVMYELICSMKIMTTDIAKLLMCGMVTDTGVFSYSSVTPNTLNVASKLLELGAPLTDICEKVFKQVAKNAFALKMRALSNAKFYYEDHIAIVTMFIKDFQATNTTEEHTEGIVSILREVEGVDIAIALSQVGERSFKVSFRTSEKADASRIAMVFGGGGHVRAAGCRLNGFYEDVIEKLLKAANDELCWE